MLKQRIFTALFLLPLAMALIFAVPAPWFRVIVAIIFLGGSREYIRLAGLSGQFSGYLLFFLQTVVFVALFQFSEQWDDRISIYLSASCAAWLLMFLRVPSYRPETVVSSGYRVISFITALLSVTTGWFAICWLHGHREGSWYILLLLLIVWAADTGAYFAGKAFGKRKLAPSISPGKTLAGFLGGLALAPVVALLALNWIPVTDFEPAEAIVLSVVTALVSVGGDLLISLHKRSSGFKDSSGLLPGHGGLLDRLDSLLAAAPFFAFGLLLARS